MTIPLPENKPRYQIRRIVVALDASECSEAALRSVVEMAKLLQAEVEGIFVEDIDLVRAVQLPFVREVRFGSALVVEIDETQLLSQLNQIAMSMRRLLQELADAAGVVWTFRVLRGQVSAEVLAAALDADLLALGQTGRGLLSGSRFGSTARVALAQSRGGLLMVDSAVDLSLPVLTIYDGSLAGERALALAVALAQQSGKLNVLLWTGDDEEAQRLHLALMPLAHTREGGPGLEISFRRFYPQEAETLAEKILGSNVGLLVLGRDSAVSSTPDSAVLANLIDALDIPFLIV